MSELGKLKTQLGIPRDNYDQDDLLEILLEDVATDILAWTNRIALPITLAPTQRQMAIIRYNMQGVEGQTSHSEGAVSRSFEELPQSIRNTLNQHRLAKVVRYGAT